MITVRTMTRRFGRFTAVDRLTFDVEEGQAVALWGPNGAGKTTAIRCILGLLRCRGTITVNGHKVNGGSRVARRQMGYVPQELAFYDDFRVSELLGFFARLKSVPKSRGADVLEEVGLTQHRRKRVRELSGGMKQRLALALALLANPPVLILDELTSNLDTRAQQAFIALLRKLRTHGKTILFTSHRLEEIVELADRVVVLDSGTKTMECTPYELEQQIGDHCVLSVVVDDKVIDNAVGTLRTAGFNATRNCRSVLVEVRLQEKALPIRTLLDSHIEVRDFELLREQTLEKVNGGENE